MQENGCDVKLSTLGIGIVCQLLRENRCDDR
jgi:hypothetical protein